MITQQDIFAIIADSRDRLTDAVLSIAYERGGKISLEGKSALMHTNADEISHNELISIIVVDYSLNETSSPYPCLIYKDYNGEEDCIAFQELTFDEMVNVTDEITWQK